MGHLRESAQSGIATVGSCAAFLILILDVFFSSECEKFTRGSSTRSSVRRGTKTDAAFNWLSKMGGPYSRSPMRSPRVIGVRRGGVASARAPRNDFWLSFNGKCSQSSPHVNCNHPPVAPAPAELGGYLDVWYVSDHEKRNLRAATRTKTWCDELNAWIQFCDGSVTLVMKLCFDAWFW